MDDSLHTNNQFISSVEASARFKLTNDHVASLARKKKIDGELRGRMWYVSADSLHTYLESMASLKAKRREALSKQLRQNHSEHFTNREGISLRELATPSEWVDTAQRTAGSALMVLLMVGFIHALSINARVIGDTMVASAFALRDAQTEILATLLYVPYFETRQEDGR